MVGTVSKKQKLDLSQYDYGGLKNYPPKPFSALLSSKSPPESGNIEWVLSRGRPLSEFWAVFPDAGKRREKERKRAEDDTVLSFGLHRQSDEEVRR